MIDINELRRLAQAASHPTTKGRWIRLFGERTVYDRMEDGCRGIPVVSTDKHPPSPFEAACLDFIAAANPAAVSEIIDRLEATEMNLRCCQSEREEAAALFLSVKNRLTDERDALRTELADLRSSMTFRTSLIGRIEAERDALRAKIEEMERQEPPRGWWDDLIADISAIDCMYRGSPTYAHDAYWMRDRVVWMLKQRRDSTPGVNGEAE